jgi:hypothetical protein
VVAHPIDNDRARRDADDRADLREAYERGRRDAVAGRKRHPVLMTFLVVAALVGVVLMALAAINGSFGGAGKVVDQNLSVAADKAEPVVRDAASDAGRAIGDAADGTETTDRPG